MEPGFVGSIFGRTVRCTSPLLAMNYNAVPGERGLGVFARVSPDKSQDEDTQVLRLAACK